MDKIVLKQVLPMVFEEHRSLMQSDVWLQDLTFEKGNSYLVEADSGTGKSSLCSYIFGYRKDFTGQILFDDKDLDGLGVKDWVDVRLRSLSVLWQDLRLFPELTAMENVQIKNQLTDFHSQKQIEEWFERLGIADKKDSKVGRLSFGQQQRVALIRSLCQPFDFFFADEPISHLDERNAEILGEILMSEAQRQGAGVIVTSIGKHMNINYHQIIML